MTTPKIDNEDIERLIDIIGDGDLTAEAQERCSKKACGRFMRACGKWPTQLFEATRENTTTLTNITQITSNQ